MPNARFLVPRTHRGPACAARSTLIGFACLAIAGSAAAVDFSVGLGGGFSRGRTDCLASLPCDHTDGHVKAFVAARVAGPFELQAAYFDAGRYHGADTTPLGTPFGGSFRVDGVAFSGGYRWAFLPDWSLTGRLGVASVRTRFGYDAPFSGQVSKTVAEPYAAASVGLALTPAWSLSLDIDQTRFKVHTTRGSLQMLGVSAQYSF